VADEGKKKTSKRKAKARKKSASTGAGSPESQEPSSAADGEGEGEKELDWRKLHLWQIQPVRDVLVVLSVLGLFWLGQKVSIVTVPLLLAILFAYLFEPVIQWLMRVTSLKRTGSVVLIIATTVLLVVVPASMGVALGIVQGAGLVTRVSTDLALTYDSVQEGQAARVVRETAQQVAPPRDEADGSASNGTDEAEGSGTPEGDAAIAEDALSEEQWLDFWEAVKTLAVEGSDGALAELGSQHESEDGFRPTAEEFRQAADRASEIDSASVRDLERQAGSTWVRVRDSIVNLGTGHTLDTALKTLQAWFRANAEEIASAGAGALRTTLGFLYQGFTFGFMVFVTAFFFFFIATGWTPFKDFVARLIPDRHRDLTLDLASKFDAVISAFIRGRLTIAFIQSIIFTLGYLIIGVPAAFILGPAVALLSVVPYLSLLGVPVSIVLLALESHTGFRGHWLWVVGAPLVIYFIGQALDDYVLTPVIQGKTTDMSTPMILFASLAGGVLFGFFGLLIAIPIAACLKILIQELFWPRFKDWAEGREKDFLPLSRE